MLKLYDYLPSGNGYKVRLALSHLGIPYERVDLDIDKGETRSADFLAKFPNGKIPALELEDGSVLWESNAITFFLAEGTDLLPADRLDRARVLQWMFFEQYSHEPYIAVSRYIAQHLELNEERRKLLESKREPGYKALRVMEGQLGARDFLVGDGYSIADIALYAYTHVADEGGFDLSDFPAVRAWLARVSAQPRHIRITDTDTGV